MKKKFTIIAAAVMLCAFLIPPLAMRGQTWEATALADLTSSDVFVIVSSHATNGTYAMSNNNGTSSAPSAVSVTVSGTALSGDIADNIKWNVSGNATDGYVFYPDGTTETWLYCTATNNGVRVGTNAANTFKIETSSGYLVHQGTSRYIGVYNNQDWRCYTSINNNIKDQTFTFYKYVDGGTSAPSISAENVSIDYDATSGAIEYTINNPVAGGELTASTTSDWLTVGEIGETVPFTCEVNPNATARTATVTLTYTYNSTDQTVTKSVTVTQAGNPNGPGSEANPYTVAQARAAIDAGTGTQGVYATGIVSAIPTAYNSTYGNITFNMVDEEGDEEFLQAYRCGGDDAANVMVGDVAVVYGNLTKYGSTYEFSQGCQVVSLTHPSSFVATPTFSPVGGTYTEAQTVTISCETEGVDIYYTIDGTDPDDESTPYSGPITIEETTTLKAIAYDSEDNVSNVATATYTITLPTVATPTFDPAAGTYTETQTVSISSETEGATIYYTTNGETPTTESNVYSSPITIEETTVVKAFAVKSGMLDSEVATATYTIQAPLSVQIFTRVDNHAVEAGQTYLIVDMNSGKALTSANGTSSAPEAVEVTIENNQISTDNGEIQWTFEAVEGGYIIYPLGSTETWLYSTNTNNGVRVGTNEDNVWTLNITDENNPNYHGFKHNGTSRYLGVYNNADWRAYTSINNNIKNTQIELFKLGDEPYIVAPSITAENIEIAYDATEGSFSFTLDNPVEGGQLSVSEEVDWISEATINTLTDGYSVSFNTMINTNSTSRQGIITLTYTYNDPIETVTKDVTVTQAAAPVVYSTIPDLFAAATSTATNVTVAFNNWVVSGVSSNGKNVFVTDGTNGFVINSSDDMSSVYSAGKILQGTVACTLKLQNGYAQLTNVNADELTMLDGGSVVFAEIAMADLTGINTGALVHYDNLTCSVENNKYYLSDGTTTLQIYTSIYNFGTALEAGKTYNISGVYQQYNTTKEVLPRNAEDIEEVVGTDPTLTVDNEDKTINVNAAGTITNHEAQTIKVHYANFSAAPTTCGVQYCDENGDELAAGGYDWITSIAQGWVSDDYFTMDCSFAENTESTARTAYVKIYAVNEGTNIYSDLVTITQAAYVVDYATLPFEFDGGRADFENTNGLTQEGLGTDYNSSPKLKFDGTGDWVILKFNEAPGTLTFDIKGNGFSGGTFTVQTSEDGMTYTDLQAYTELGNTQSESFANLGENVRYIKWIYTEKVSGNVALGNINLYQYGVGPVLPASITVAPATVNVNSDEHDGTLALTYENLTISAMTDFSIQYYDVTGEEASAPDWIEVLVAEQDPTIGEGYVVSYYMMENTGEARSAYFKVHAQAGEETVYSNLVTVNQDAYVAPVPTEDYALFTGDLIEGDYLIVYDNRAMNTTVTGDRLQFDNVEPENDVIATNNAAIIWHIAPSGDYWTIYNAEANAYAAGTGVKNKAQMLADGTDDKALWTVSGTETFEFVNKANAAAGVNANLRNNGTYGFACYATGTGGALTLYKKVTSTVTYNKEISGYGESEGGYYLIASPIYGLNPANVAGMTDVTTSDLYYFDQTQEAEWRNYKAHAFYLTPGKGYLYAKTEDVTLTFAGMPYEGNGIVNLTYDEAAQFAGWNLIGNPFGTNASLNMPYYRLNSDGSEVSASLESTNVAVMEGVFVEATETVLTATFTASRNAEQQGIAQANIMVSGDRGTVIDNAIVRFDGGATLGKFQLNENSTKLYISQNGSEYAVVRSTAEGEMPVNFKANRNGSYTITINTENVKMDYLHLIDNMTGADVDLLATPSYSFEARTTDYASRFRLVFSANNLNESEDGDSFGFVNVNGNLSIFGIEGEATVQVIDVQGHILSSETFSGSYEKQLNAAPGVYMIRLINGNDVKVQKIVIK